ncbi:unnamed protein product [Caenorhabditis auriculariae]|uniref:Uncharacterized protein n=1 Tax=Caenorhabditis auriculariae TaxID=2777116 RepID=A0A8S1GTR4_9PELO|nr:unnamed protein product [Caenorhabditis auriculariae]
MRLVAFTSCLCFVAVGIEAQAQIFRPTQQQVSASRYPLPRRRLLRSAHAEGAKQFRDAKPVSLDRRDGAEPRLLRATGRFHRRVQSATTHEIASVALPQDWLQIVSYSYDPRNHHEKKLDEDKILSSDVVEYAKDFERTTVAVKVMDEISTTPLPSSTESFNSINSLEVPGRPQFFQQSFQEENESAELKQPPSIFTQGSILVRPAVEKSETSAEKQHLFTPPSPPSSPPTMSLLPNPLLGPPLGLQPNPIFAPNGHNTLGAANFQPTNPLAPPVINPAQGNVQSTILQPAIPQTQPQPVYPNSPTGQIQVYPGQASSSEQNVHRNLHGPRQPSGTLSGIANSTYEQLGCGFDWLTNQCKDVFNLGWCGKCHDFGNVFLHDCKCVAPLTSLSPSPPPRHPNFFWFL